MIKRRLLQILCLTAFVLWEIHLYQTQGVVRIGGATVESIQLQRGPFLMYDYAAPVPKARIIFGSGDGGWGPWEDAISCALRANGYTVIGIDCAVYANSDYDLATLQSDYAKIAQTLLARDAQAQTPLIVGGWSMGAAQAIAVAGGPHPPAGLVGVLAVSPLSRGRYGLRLADRLNVLPSGPGTFAVKDFTQGLNGLAVAQWHAEKDTIDSRDWLGGLKTVHREYDLTKAGHDYDDASPEFRGQLVESVAWILSSSPAERTGK